MRSEDWGEKGSGKSTLLEAIAISYGFHPDGGTKNSKVPVYSSYPELCSALQVLRGYRKAGRGYFLKAESFLEIVQEQLQPNGLYIFDEPEAVLSPQRQLTLLWEISECAKKGSQFIIATHSPILLGMPDAEILCFDSGAIHPCKYEETDSYQVTKMFVNHRKQFLERLLG